MLPLLLSSLSLGELSSLSLWELLSLSLWELSVSSVDFLDMFLLDAEATIATSARWRQVGFGREGGAVGVEDVTLVCSGGAIVMPLASSTAALLVI
ncbi:hypothetical protein L208DRAFT_230136 [Tricholoma matsutake]|nr:hypothetical protein L208DRAFT_230136 [Tricholoma matsutake 945]